MKKPHWLEKLRSQASSSGSFLTKLTTQIEVENEELITEVRRLLRSGSVFDKLSKRAINDTCLLIDNELIKGNANFITVERIGEVIETCRGKMSKNARQQLNEKMIFAWVKQYVYAKNAIAQQKAMDYFKECIKQVPVDARAELVKIIEQVNKLKTDSVEQNGITFESKLLSKLINAANDGLDNLDRKVIEIEEQRIALIEQRKDNLRFDFGEITPAESLAYWEADYGSIDVHPSQCAIDEIMNDGPMLRPILAYLGSDIRNPNYLVELLRDLRRHEARPDKSSYTIDQINQAARTIVGGLLWNEEVIQGSNTKIKEIILDSKSSIAVVGILLDLEILDPKIVWDNFIASNPNHQTANTPSVISKETVIDQMENHWFHVMQALAGTTISTEARAY